MLPVTVYLNHQEHLLVSQANTLEPFSSHVSKNPSTAIAWVRSHDIRFATITIPKLAHSLRMQAVAFELEERLLLDTSDLHFAIVTDDEVPNSAGEETMHVACIPKATLNRLISATQQHNITLKAACPDIFLLPWEQSDHPVARVFLSNDVVIVRTGLFEGFAGDRSLLPYIIHQIAQLGDTAEVALYVTQGAPIPKPLAHYKSHTISIRELMQLAAPNKLNLLQDEFEPTSALLLGIKTALPILKPMALVCLLLGMSSTLSYASKYVETQAIHTAILQQLQKNAPEVGAQWQQQLSQQLTYYQNARRNTLPWRRFQELLPVLGKCQGCKITSLTVNQDGIAVALLSNRAQSDFTNQSFGTATIEITSNTPGNHSYQLRWAAE